MKVSRDARVALLGVVYRLYSSHPSCLLQMGRMLRFFKNILDRITSNPCRRYDVVRCVNEKCIDTLSNFFRCEAFREQMERYQERRIRIPIGEVKCNFVRPKNLFFAGLIGNERGRDGRNDAGGQSHCIERGGSVASQLSEDGRDFFAN